MTKEESLKMLQTLPGVGKSIALDLWHQGYHSPSDLRNADPEEMYKKQCELQGTNVDRCLLYVFRCVVYYTSRDNHDPVLLKWWNWKDRTYKAP